VGLLSALRPGLDLYSASALYGPTAGIRSPWLATPSHLETVVWADIFGEAAPATISRADAMRVDAVNRSRGIICTTIARIELRQYRGDDEKPLPRAESAGWLNPTNGTTAAFHRMLWTIDDLLFYDWSLWRRTSNDAAGRFPLAMERIPIGGWEFEQNTNRVLIPKPDGRGGVSMQPAHQGEVVLIPGTGSPLLTDGIDAIRHAADLNRAASRAARHPSAYLAIKQTAGAPLKRRSDDATEVTVESTLANWREARNNPDGGGVAFLSTGLEAEELGAFGDHLYVEGRNRADIGVARHAGIPADLIDAAVGEGTLQYSTSRDNDRRAIDYGLGAFMAAVSGRFTQDDVTPHGNRVAFDLEQWLKGTAPGQPTDQTTEPAPGPLPRRRGAPTTPGESPQ
jgi:hypothetical protein